MPTHKPLILAHRGLVTHHQENTIPAIEAALNGPHADGAEFDVFLTKDNKVVLFHDENMKRLTGVDRNISEMTWNDLKTIQILPNIEVDGGVRAYGKYGRIPLLEEALETFKGKDFFVDIELKAYSLSYKKRKVGGEAAKILRKMDMFDQLICTSFNFFMLYNLEKEHRATPTAYAYDDDMPLPMKWINRIMESNLIGKMVHSSALCSEYTLIDENTIQKYHQKGMKVGCFTLYPLAPQELSTERKAFFSKEVKRLVKMGVDWIETDHPELVWSDLQND